MLKILLNCDPIQIHSLQVAVSFVKETLFQEKGLLQSDYYLLVNGKKVNDEDILSQNCRIHVVPRLVGGKGGFGSMLRAIGAQIEKTTNREACRDLSGRRLRDINEEQRLKNWIAQQVEREKETAERKKKKLERLCQEPKHEFKDVTYDKERSELSEKVEEALVQGLQTSASTSTSGQKRTKDDLKTVPKKRAKLWLDDDVGDLTSSSDDDDGEIQNLSKLVQANPSSSTLNKVALPEAVRNT